MKSTVPAVLTVLFLMMAGCASKEPVVYRQPGKLMLPAKSGENLGGDAAASPAQAVPICLHVRGQTKNYLVYSEAFVEGFVTRGECKAGEPRYTVDNISVNVMYKGGSRGGNTCTGTDSCTFNDRHYGVTREIDCFSANSTSGSEKILTTTDPRACPY